jgi:hypothetical protein
MNWKTGLAAALVTSSLLFAAQRPGPDGPPPPPRAETPGTAPAQVDPEVGAWVQVLAQKVGDRNETIRRSAHMALVAVGRPALPTMRILSGARDDSIAAAAKDIVARIESGPGPRGIPGGPDGPGPRGEPGFGPRPRMDPLLEALSRLEIPDAQKSAVAEIRNAHAQKSREILERGREQGLEPEEVHAQHKQLVQETLARLKSVLSEEQCKQLEESARREPPRPPRGPLPK